MTLADIRDVVQIAFFTVIATVTILTYIHAKRTILQPLRTEVFKQQLKLMSDILDFLTAEYEGAINTVFPLDDLLKINTIQMFDDYAERMLSLEIIRDQRPYAPQNCPHYLLPHHLIVEAGAYRQPERSEREPAAPPWSEYKYEAIAIPSIFVDAQEKVRTFARSPLAPEKLVDLLQALDQELHRRVIQVGEVLTECAQEMPTMYPTAERLKDSSFSWIQNRFNRKAERLESTIDQITDYARTYFGPENLLT